MQTWSDAEVKSRIKEAISAVAWPEPHRIDMLFAQLGAISGNNIAEITKVMLDERQDADLREFACWVLGALAHPDSSPALVKASQSQNAAIRRGALKALATYGDDTSTEILCNALRDIDEETQIIAAVALGLRPKRDSFDCLSAEFTRHDISDKLKGIIAEALGNLGDARAIELFVETVHDASSEVRYWIAYALGELKDPRAIPILNSLVNDVTVVPEEGKTVADEARAALNRIAPH